MKQNIILAGIFCLAMLTACVKDEFTNNNTSDAVEYIIEASLGENTKALFNDGESISWAIGDDVVIMCDNTTTKGTHTITETSLKNNKLTFNSKLLNQGAKFVVIKAECNGKKFNDTQIRFISKQSQTKAGKMTDLYIPLHSPVTEAPAKADGTTPVVIPITINIIGSIYRFIPYTTKYNDENVKSVQFIATDGTTMAGEPGIMGKDYAQPLLYKRGDGQYDNTCRICWTKEATKSSEVTTELETEFPLDGISNAELSKGIYMSLAAIAVKGYKYVVTTDKAVYTFDSSDKALKISENEVKNIRLNLDRATTREEL